MSDFCSVLLGGLQMLPVICWKTLTMPYSSDKVPSGDSYFFPLTIKVVIVQNHAHGAYKSRVTVPGFVLQVLPIGVVLFLLCCWG